MKLSEKTKPEKAKPEKLAKLRPYFWAVGLWCAGFGAVAGLSFAFRLAVKMISQ